MPKAIRPMPPGAISRRHSAGVSVSQHRRPGGAPASRRHLPARAEQSGRRGLQRRGELAQRGRGRAGPGTAPGTPGTAGSSRPGRPPAPGSGRSSARRRATRLLRSPGSGGDGQEGSASCVRARFRPQGSRPGYGLNGHRDRGVADPARAWPPAPLHLLGSLTCVRSCRAPHTDQPGQDGAWRRVALATSGRDVRPPPDSVSTGELLPWAAVAPGCRSRAMVPAEG